MFRKVLTTVIGALVFQTSVLAQVYVKSTGVGIGIATPTEKFHVSGKTLIDASDNVLSFNSPNGAWQYLAFNKGGQRKLWMGLNGGTDFHIRNEQPGGHLFLQPVNGRVYIESEFDNGAVGGTITFRHPGKIGNGEARDWVIYNMKAGYGNSLQFWAYGSDFSRPALILADNGNIGIGLFPDVQYKLQVNGIVKATSYEAAGPTYWPDYVFESTHQLPSLPEVENYIKQNHHLPEVPSAEDVKKDGLNLVNNQATLLKKIEELTLYVIEQDKQIKRLKNENQEMSLLKKEMEEIKDILKQIKK